MTYPRNVAKVNFCQMTSEKHRTSAHRGFESPHNAYMCVNVCDMTVESRTQWPLDEMMYRFYREMMVQHGSAKCCCCCCCGCVPNNLWAHLFELGNAGKYRIMIWEMIWETPGYQPYINKWSIILFPPWNILKYRILAYEPQKWGIVMNCTYI